MAENGKECEKVDPFRRFWKTRAQSRDFYLGLVLLCFAVGLLVYIIPFHVEVQFAHGMAVKPTFFPYFMSSSILFLSGLLIWKSNKTSQDATRSEDKKVSKATIVFIALLFAGYLGIFAVGMLPMGVMMVFVLVRAFGYRNWVRALVFSVVFAVLLFFFFEKIAQVSIPRGFLFEDWY